MARIRIVVFGILVAAFAGCAKSDKETAEKPAASAAQQPAAEAAQSAPAVAEPEPAQMAPAPAAAPKPRVEKKGRPAQTAPAPAASTETLRNEVAAPPAATNAAAPTQREPEAPAAPKPPEPKFAVIPDGEVLNVRLQDALDSGINKAGEVFETLLDRDIVIDGKTAAPKGSVLKGRISQVAQSGRIEGRASMALQLTSIEIAGRVYPIQTEILAFEAESTRKKDVAKVGVGAGLGAVIGAIAGGGKGAAIGAAVGAGAGGATVAATRGKEVQMEKEHKLSFVLSRDVSVRLQ